MTPLSETEKNLGKSKHSGGRRFMAKAVASISALATLAGGMALYVAGRHMIRTPRRKDE